MRLKITSNLSSINILNNREWGLGLRWLLLHGMTQQPPIVGRIVGVIWERRRTRRRRLGRTWAHLFGHRITEQKINETKFVVALGGCQSMISHNNQPNYRGRDGGGIGEDARPSGNAGGGRILSFWGRSSWEGGENIQ